MNRWSKVEYLRVIAMFAVIVNHVNVAALHIFDYSQAMGIAYVSYGFHVLSRFAVPCFFAISGYLMLGRGYSLSIKKLVKKSIPKYGLCLLLYGTGFAWMELVFDSGKISIAQIPTAFCQTLTGKTWDHMWFLYAYLGLLCFFPVLKHFWSHAKVEEKRFVLISGLLLTEILPMFSIVIAYPMSTYILCFLFGGYLHDLEEKKICIPNTIPIIVGGAICVVLLVLTYWDHYQQALWAELLLDDTSVFLLGLSACLCIVFLLNGSCKPASKRLLQVSVNSFGVYIYHMVWINVLYKVIRLNPFQFSMVEMMGCILLSVVAVFFLSLATTMITKKIPFLKSLL